jgi:hypothetical protein
MVVGPPQHALEHGLDAGSGHSADCGTERRVLDRQLLRRGAWCPRMPYRGMPRRQGLLPTPIAAAPWKGRLGGFPAIRWPWNGHPSRRPEVRVP